MSSWKHSCMLGTTSLPNKDILCLTRTPSLQKRLKTLRRRRRSRMRKKRKTFEAVRHFSGYSKAEQRWRRLRRSYQICVNHLGNSLQGASRPHSSSSPCHHLLFLIGGMAPTADWMNDCRQEVQPVVFEVLVYQG